MQAAEMVSNSDSEYGKEEWKKSEIGDETDSMGCFRSDDDR